MKVNNINTYTSTVNSFNNYPSFNGRIILKGKNWNNYLADTFCDSYAIKHLAEGEKDIIARVKTKTAPKEDTTHLPNETIYKFNIEMKSPSPTFKERLKSLLRLTRKDICKDYHSESCLAQKIEFADLKELAANQIDK